jgi:hypothetical protein
MSKKSTRQTYEIYIEPKVSTLWLLAHCAAPGKSGVRDAPGWAGSSSPGRRGSGSPRWRCVIAGTVIRTVLCFLVIFFNQFNT